MISMYLEEINKKCINLTIKFISLKFNIEIINTNENFFERIKFDEEMQTRAYLLT